MAGAFRIQRKLAVRGRRFEKCFPEAGGAGRWSGSGSDRRAHREGGERAIVYRGRAEVGQAIPGYAAGGARFAGSTLQWVRCCAAAVGPRSAAAAARVDAYHSGGGHYGHSVFRARQSTAGDSTGGKFPSRVGQPQEIYSGDSASGGNGGGPAGAAAQFLDGIAR